MKLKMTRPLAVHIKALSEKRDPETSTLIDQHLRITSSRGAIKLSEMEASEIETLRGELSFFSSESSVSEARSMKRLMEQAGVYLSTLPAIEKPIAK